MLIAIGCQLFTSFGDQHWASKLQTINSQVVLTEFITLQC